MQVYAIYDKKAQTYKTFEAVNEEVAIRQLKSTKGTQLNDYPSDFELYYVADFLEFAGSYVNSENKPRFICNLTVIFGEPKNDEK